MDIEEERGRSMRIGRGEKRRVRVFRRVSHPKRDGLLGALLRLPRLARAHEEQRVVMPHARVVLARGHSLLVVHCSLVITEEKLHLSRQNLNVGREREGGGGEGEEVTHR